MNQKKIAGSTRFALFGAALAAAALDTQAAMTARATEPDVDYTGTQTKKFAAIDDGHCEHAGGAGTSVGVHGVTKMAQKFGAKSAPTGEGSTDVVALATTDSGAGIDQLCGRRADGGGVAFVQTERNARRDLPTPGNTKTKL